MNFGQAASAEHVQATDYLRNVHRSAARMSENCVIEGGQSEKSQGEHRMKKPPGIVTNPVRIISVSPIADDHTSLYDILHDANWSLDTNCTWALYPICTLASAADALKQEEVPIVISECKLLPGTWRDILEQSSVLSVPPLLVVTSQSADERLRSQVLDLGGWDLLSKPFDATEVIRILSLAWQQWLYRKGVHRIRTNQRTLRQEAS
jgi:hypothetical protein